ncbi:MAG: histidine kinase N-terminal 7TM domain-containing protein [archaeon]
MPANVILVLALATSVIANSLLLIYLLLKGIKSNAAWYFVLFMIAVVLHVIGDLFFQTASSIRDALFWIFPYWVGLFFMAIFFFFFAINFPNAGKIDLAGSKARMILFMIPLALIYMLIFSSDFATSIIVPYEGVNFIEYGNLYWVAIGYLALFLGLGLFILYDEYKKTKIQTDRNNITLVFAGIFIATFFGLMGDVFLIKFLGFGEIKLTSVFVLASCVIMGYAVVGHKIFSITPVSEEEEESKLTFATEAGRSYFFEEKNISRRRAFRIFSDLVKHNKQGLLISTIYPEQIRGIYNLQKTPILWVSDSPECGAQGNCLQARELEALSRTITGFMDKAQEPIILIEGVGRFVEENGSSKVIAFLKTINAHAIETGAVVFFSLREKEVEFMNLFNEVNSLKADMIDLEKKFFTHAISVEAYTDLVLMNESKIIEREAKLKVVEEELLGKIAAKDEYSYKKAVYSNSLLIIDYQLAKRHISEVNASFLRGEIEKKMISLERSSKKKDMFQRA